MLRQLIKILIDEQHHLYPHFKMHRNYFTTAYNSVQLLYLEHFVSGSPNVFINVFALNGTAIILIPQIMRVEKELLRCFGVLASYSSGNEEIYFHHTQIFPADMRNFLQTL